jgi:hypothetical protein
MQSNAHLPRWTRSNVSCGFNVLQFFQRNSPQFFVTFSRFANPGKILEITWYSQDEVIIFSYIHEFNIERICHRRNEILVEFCTGNCTSLSENIQISYCFQESGFSYLLVLFLSIWLSGNSQKMFTNSEPRNWKRKFLSVILSRSHHTGHIFCEDWTSDVGRIIGTDYEILSIPPPFPQTAAAIVFRCLTKSGISASHVIEMVVMQLMHFFAEHSILNPGRSLLIRNDHIMLLLIKPLLTTALINIEDELRCNIVRISFPISDVSSRNLL